MSILSKDLRKAAARDDMPEVHRLLARRAEVLDADGGGKTALHYAARAGAQLAVLHFLSMGIDPNVADRNGERPRDEAEWWAIKSQTPELRARCLEILRDLIERGAECSEHLLRRRPHLQAWAERHGVTVPWQTYTDQLPQSHATLPETWGICQQTGYHQSQTEDWLPPADGPPPNATADRNAAASNRLQLPTEVSPSSALNEELPSQLGRSTKYADFPNQDYEDFGHFLYQFQATRSARKEELPSQLGRPSQQADLTNLENEDSGSFLHGALAGVALSRDSYETAMKQSSCFVHQCQAATSARDEEPPSQRGRSTGQVGLTNQEYEDAGRFASSLQELQRSVDELDSVEEHWGSMWEDLWNKLESVCSFRFGCWKCQEDADKFVLQRVRALKDAWYDHQLWPQSLVLVRHTLRRQLEEPSAITTLPIEEIRYTHNSAGRTFRHGAHRGMPVSELVRKLVSGRVSTTDQDMTLDVVRYHGMYWSLNNRHLKAHREYLQHQRYIQSRKVTGAAAEVASVRIWPLAPGLRLHRMSLIDKFSRSLSTRDDGRSLSLHTRASSVASAASSRNVSREGRRVRFTFADE